MNTSYQSAEEGVPLMAKTEQVVENKPKTQYLGKIVALLVLAVVSFTAYTAGAKNVAASAMRFNSQGDGPPACVETCAYTCMEQHYYSTVAACPCFQHCDISSCSVGEQAFVNEFVNSGCHDHEDDDKYENVPAYPPATADPPAAGYTTTIAAADTATIPTIGGAFPPVTGNGALPPATGDYPPLTGGGAFPPVTGNGAMPPATGDYPPLTGGGAFPPVTGNGAMPPATFALPPTTGALPPLPAMAYCDDSGCCTSDPAGIYCVTQNPAAKACYPLDVPCSGFTGAAAAAPTKLGANVPAYPPATGDDHPLTDGGDYHLPTGDHHLPTGDFHPIPTGDHPIPTFGGK